MSQSVISETAPSVQTKFRDPGPSCGLLRPNSGRNPLLLESGLHTAGRASRILVHLVPKMGLGTRSVLDFDNLVFPQSPKFL